MSRLVKFFFYIAMAFMGAVSVWTSYVSLRDSIFPVPAVHVPLGKAGTWNCAVVALMIALALALMLFALKAAIIDGQRRLNLLGLLGLALLGLVSMAFNMDVFYRTANPDFYLRHSAQQVRGAYEPYLAAVQGRLTEKQRELHKILARQEGAIEAEIKGAQAAPAPGGPVKTEDAMLAREAERQLAAIGEASKTKARADQLLASKIPATVEEIQQLQNDLRAALKDMESVTEMPLPTPVQVEPPLFTVFNRLAQWRTIGVKEVFFLMLAILLDLGDVIGYMMLPRRRHEMIVAPAPPPALAPPAQQALPVINAPERLLAEPNPLEPDEE